jgi:hypothetical protein
MIADGIDVGNSAKKLASTGVCERGAEGQNDDERSGAAQEDERPVRLLFALDWRHEE